MELSAVERALMAGWDPFAHDGPATVLTWRNAHGDVLWTIALPTATLEAVDAHARAKAEEEAKAAHRPVPEVAAKKARKRVSQEPGFKFEEQS